MRMPDFTVFCINVKLQYFQCENKIFLILCFCLGIKTQKNWKVECLNCYEIYVKLDKNSSQIVWWFAGHYKPQGNIKEGSGNDQGLGNKEFFAQHCLLILYFFSYPSSYMEWFPIFLFRNPSMQLLELGGGEKHMDQSLSP